MSSSDRWYVKKEGDAQVYALTERLGDAELLAARLTRSTGDSFYSMKKPTTVPGIGVGK